MPKKQSVATTDPEQKTYDQLLLEINSAKEAIDIYTKQKKRAEAELLARRQEEIQKLLKDKDEPYGAVNIVVGNHKITITVPKKVEWSQRILEDIWMQMIADGERPEQVIDVEYSIKESKYKVLPEDWQKEFMQARTVSPGSPSVKMSDSKE